MTATPSNSTGNIGYQWYSGPSADAATTPISGATATIYAPAGALTTTTYYGVTAVHIGSGCVAATATPVAVTVRGQFSPGAIATSGQTVCVGGTLSQIGNASAASGGNSAFTYTWYKNSTIIGGATANAYTPLPTDATAAGTHTYTRKVRDGVCNTTPEQSTGSWVLTVIAAPTVSIASAQSVCSGTQPTAMTATPVGGTGAFTCQWYSGAGATAATATISGATASTYRPAAITQTTWYRVITTYSGSGCAATATAIAKTVYDDLVPGAIPSSTTTICKGGTVSAFTATAPSGGDKTYTYQWYQSGSVASGTSNAASFTPTGTYLSAPGTYRFTRVVTSCTSGTTTGTHTLVVLDDPTVMVASAESLCSGMQPAAMTATPSGGTGTITYRWYSGATSVTATTDLGSSATASTYRPAAITTTTWYRVVATFSGSGCDAATATAIEKKVWDALTPGVIASSTTTICKGGTVAAFTATAPTGGNGTYTYQWKQGSGNATGTSTASSFTPSGTYLSTPDTYRFTRVVTSCTSGTTTGTHTLVVLDDPTVTVASAESLCSGTQPAAMTATPSGGTGTITYRWYSGATSVTATTDLGSTTASTYRPAAITTTTWYRVITTYSGSGCAATATAIAKTVYDALVPGAITSSTTTICKGGTVSAFTATAPSGGNGNYTYQWYQSGSVATGMSTAASFTPTGTYLSTPGTYRFTRVVTSCTSGTTTGTYTLVVHDLPGAPTNPSNNTRCGTGDVTFSATTATGCTIDWYTAASGGSTVSLGTASLTANVNAGASSTYYAQSRNTTTGCVSTSRLAVTGIAYAVPSVNTTNPAARCGAGAVILWATAGGGTTTANTYTWKVGTAQAQTTTANSYTTASIAAGSTTYSVTVTNAYGCASTAATGTITVHPAFSAGSITTASYKNCNNVAGTATTVPSGGTPTGNGSYSYQWTVSYNAGAAVTINGATLATYSPPATATAGTYRYMRQVKDGLCNTAFTNSAGTVTREVYQAFSAGAITTASSTTTPGTNPNVTIANASSATGGDGNITYQWRRSGTSSATLTGTNATYALSADASSNYGSAGTYYFTRYAKHGACSSAYTASSGQYTLKVALAISLPPFSGTQTWTCGIQQWSGLLSYNIADCLQATEWPGLMCFDISAVHGYYYGCNAPVTLGALICPQPWRVPTPSDFAYLISHCYESILKDKWPYNGYIYNNKDSPSDQGAAMVLWSDRSTAGNDVKDCLSCRYPGTCEVTARDCAQFQFQIRCVKSTD
jgi:hypothetical protein